MSEKTPYEPGPANLARVHKDGETWTLVLEKDLRHPPATVWRALTEPERVREWAPFDVSGSLGIVGVVDVTWVGSPTVVETRVQRADAPRLLIYTAGENTMRWELEARNGGTRLTLWAAIDRRFISMGAAGWHIAFDVLEHLLDGSPIGRIAGAAGMEFDGWRRLNTAYAEQFGVTVPTWQAKSKGAST